MIMFRRFTSLCIATRAFICANVGTNCTIICLATWQALRKHSAYCLAFEVPAPDLRANECVSTQLRTATPLSLVITKRTKTAELFCMCMTSYSKHRGTQMALELQKLFRLSPSTKACMTLTSNKARFTVASGGAPGMLPHEISLIATLASPAEPSSMAAQTDPYEPVPSTSVI